MKQLIKDDESLQSCVSVSVADLRIGNYLLKSLKSGNGRKINDKIGVQDIVRIYEKTGSFNYELIPITEEWLLKFGFVSNPYQDRYEKGDIDVECDKTKGETVLWLSGAPHIKYIHQLQNLYYILTGLELQIN
jgi:hypothetical protein